MIYKGLMSWSECTRASVVPSFEEQIKSRFSIKGIYIHMIFLNSTNSKSIVRLKKYLAKTYNLYSSAKLNKNAVSVKIIFSAILLFDLQTYRQSLFMNPYIDNNSIWILKFIMSISSSLCFKNLILQKRQCIFHNRIWDIYLTEELQVKKIVIVNHSVQVKIHI